jgi:peptidoglycan hydrolase-like protein with peptidoglycan-binding domain
VDRESVDGTLGYAGARTIVNRLAGASDDGPSRGRGGANGPDASAGGGAGGSVTLTRTAPAGSVVGRGGALYWADDEPVVLMYGATPAYRTLRPGVSPGPDVAQLEANLAALGFDPGIVDDEFSSSTVAAIRAWQQSSGLDATGRVELGRVVFLGGARRIGARKASIGDPLTDGQEVLETTARRRVVSIELDVAKQALVRVGDTVRVTLPSGTTARGRITHVGRVAHAKSGEGDPTGSSDAASGGGELVIDVTVVLRSTRGLGRLDQAPVSVAIASERRRNALVAPVNALVARPGGGYAVELAASGRLTRVRPGMFADGLVEISGREIREGVRVVVPE